MSDKTRRRAATLALVLGLAALHVILMLTALHWVGTDAELYYSEQMQADVLPESGLCDAALRTLDSSMANYLKGDRDALTPGNPFNEKEMTHMADCYDLFALLRKVRARLIPWAIVLILGGAWLLRDRKTARLCAWLSPLIVLLPLGIFALYAALDFNGAFTLFHRILFSNDLWLLDPATDVLIRICPASMFMHMGVRIAVCSVIGMLAASVIVTIITFAWPKGKEENSWKTTTRRGPASRQYDFANRGRR